MTDIRDRLADALQERWDYEEINETCLKHADLMLSLPGIAIVDTEADIEQVAIALCNGYFGADDGWDRCVVEYGRELWRRSARAALAAAVQAQEEK